MHWFRRNLFWALFGLISLVLLGCGGFYLYSGIQNSAEVESEVDRRKSDLNRLVQHNPSFTDDNITVARRSAQQLQDVLNREEKYFTRIPLTNVTETAFLTNLHSQVYYLRKLAERNNVGLPKDCAFSFEEQMNKARFNDPRLLAEQLAEVRLICSLLFDSRINRFTALKRYATPDDAGNSPFCHALPRQVFPNTNLVSSPYEVTFSTFSSELAKVLETMARLDKFLAVKVLVVDRQADTKGLTMDATTPAADPRTPADAAARQAWRPPVQGGRRPQPPGQPGRPLTREERAARIAPPLPPLPRTLVAPAVAAVAPRAGPGQDTLQVVLNEQAFRVTLLAEVLKPLK